MRRWGRAPQGQVPGVVPWRFVIARSDLAVASVTGVDAYPNGLSIDLELRIGGALAIDRRLFHRALDLRPEHPGTVRLSLVAADGELRPALRGGAGSDGTVGIGYWLSPLPAADRIELVFEWPAAGIAETRVELDGRELHAAAARAVVVWTDEGA